MSLTKRSNDAKNYFKATIKLSEAYVRTKDHTKVKKSIFMLETIFPKVLLTKAKLLISELYLTYAEALDTSGNVHFLLKKDKIEQKLIVLLYTGIQTDVLEYITLAINGKKIANRTVEYMN